MMEMINIDHACAPNSHSESVGRKRSTSRVERLAQIAALLRENRYLSVELLARRMGVSPVTIRRDLGGLARQGVATRVHGGLMANDVPPDDASFASRYRQQADEKGAIARRAAAHVRDGNTVALDVGSTAVYLARELAARRVTVVTNSLRAAQTLADGRATLVVVGGYLRPGEHSLLGPEAISVIQKFRFDTFFLGAGGASPRGVTDHSVEEVEVKRAFMRCSNHTFALLDSSKLGGGIRAWSSPCWRKSRLS